MILKQLINERFPLGMVVFHLFLGVAAATSSTAIIAWLYGFFLLSLPLALVGRRKDFTILNSLIVYGCALEIVARMAGTAPLIPHELSKYLMFVLLMLGIIKGQGKGKLGWWMVLLLLPGTFIDRSGLAGFSSLVFNFLGPLNLGLAVVYFKGQQISKGEFISLMRLLLYPMISVLAFTILRSPAIQESQFDLLSSHAFSAGYGPNQVSTALGLGAFLCFVFWFARWRLTGWRLVDLGLVFIFTFQGLLTFSRGGVVGGALGVFAVVFIIFMASAVRKRQFQTPTVGKYSIPVLLLAFGSFTLVDNLTGGTLGLRYKGETAGTQAGSKERDFNTLTAERWSILVGDFMLMEKYPLFGTGVGSSRWLRPTSKGMSPHVEMSRLAAEHGILGLIFFVLWIYLGWIIFRSKGDPLLKGVLLALFLIAVFTSFHAATRTFVTPLLTGLSMLQISYEPKNYIHRQSVERRKLQPDPV